MISYHTKIEIFLDDKIITVMNQENGRTKSFPRCGITKIESFVQEMARSGKLNDLISN